MGVILTGGLDDGVAGLLAILSCGGVAVVQNPSESDDPALPAAALAAVAPVLVASLEQMPQIFWDFARSLAAVNAAAPRVLELEQSIANGEGSVAEMEGIGAPSPYSCPECGGVLFELSDRAHIRYRCHTGHAFSLRSLARTQSHGVDAALWAGLRGLREKEALMRRIAAAATGGDAVSALMEANELSEISDALRDLLERLPRPRL